MTAAHDATIDRTAMHDAQAHDDVHNDEHNDIGNEPPLRDVEEFLDKWRRRWPEWRIAQTFVNPAQRVRTEAWFALLQEFTDAAWNGADPTPGIAKLGWWQDELRGWAKGARRHPLGVALHKLQAPWPALAASLSALQAARDVVLAGEPSGVESLADRLRPCADAIDACERVLFGDATGSDAREPAAIDPKAGLILIAIHVLWASADAPEPQRHTAYAGRLHGVWPQPATTRCRRIYDALIRKRLQSTATGAALAPLSPWSALWVAWRAARG